MLLKLYDLFIGFDRKKYIKTIRITQIISQTEDIRAELIFQGLN